MTKKDFDNYIHNLTNKYRTINSIWLYGSQVNNRTHDKSDWDILVFTDLQTCIKIEKDSSIKNDEIDLLITNNNNNFYSPWDNKKLSLCKIEWNYLSEINAKYKAYDKREFQESKTFELNIYHAKRIWQPMSGTIGTKYGDDSNT